VNGQLTPEEESVLLAKLLTHWALRSTLNDPYKLVTTATRFDHPMRRLVI
jgi:hypothetical protein